MYTLHCRSEQTLFGGEFSDRTILILGTHEQMINVAHIDLDKAIQ